MSDKEMQIDGIPEKEMWQKYRATGDQSIRDAIVKQYAPLVKYVAGKVSVGMPQSVDFDDLVGFGVFGLFDAIEKFDPDKHIKFKTYAVTRIRGAIFDELRSIDWVPRSVRQKNRELDETVQHLEAKIGRSATHEEIACEMGISIEQYNHMLLSVSGTSLLSLNDVWYTGEDNDQIPIVENIESPSGSRPDTLAEKGEMRRVIIETIKELPEKEQKVLVLYYYEDLTLKEIGKVLDVTESRVSQLHTKAISRLRTKLTNIKKGIF